MDKDWMPAIKKAGIGATLGTLLALWLAYVLGDLNGGAFATLLFLCIGVVEIVVWGISLLIRWRRDK